MWQIPRKYSQDDNPEENFPFLSLFYSFPVKTASQLFYLLSHVGDVSRTIAIGRKRSPFVFQVKDDYYFCVH